jgi:hypothetical protein
MNTLDAEFLFSRLPAFYQQRDAEAGGPLRALLTVIAEQGAVLDDDISRLYDNWFIETCEDWIVAYIGDLLGVRGLYSVAGTSASGQRAHVANTLALRRRKGTLPVLEQLAMDTTGWRAHAVEFFQLLSTTQYLNHPRFANVRTPDLRHAALLERTDGPFDLSAHTADTRALPAGRYNIPNIGIYVWRLQAYAVQRGTARAVTTRPGFFTFDPIDRSFGDDLPPAEGRLYNRPRTGRQITDLSQPVNVPEPLSRRVLHDELTALQAALAEGKKPQSSYFATESGGPVLRLWLDGAEVPDDKLVVCNLRALAGAAPEEWRRPPAGLVGFDPVLGRIALPAGQAVATVEAAYAYGFPGDVGGGPYDRRPARREDEADFGMFDPTHFSTLRVPDDHATLADALAALVVGERTLIRLNSDATEAIAPDLHLPDTEVVIEASNLRRPVLIGDWKIRGNANTRVGLSGLWVDGQVRLQGALRSLDVRHCSLSPGRGGIRHTGNGATLSIMLSNSICGPVRATKPIAGVAASACIFDGSDSGVAFDFPDAALGLDRCTIFGTTAAGELDAGNSIFNATVTIERCQQGCVRFSYVPVDSVTPRRYRCQPELAMHGTLKLSLQKQKAERLRVTPTYTSVVYGSAAYAQLRLTSAPEILRGAEDGGEMGVWNLLQQTQREANLRQALDEYLRFGLDAGVIFVN